MDSKLSDHVLCIIFCTLESIKKRGVFHFSLYHLLDLIQYSTGRCGSIYRGTNHKTCCANSKATPGCIKHVI